MIGRTIRRILRIAISLVVILVLVVGGLVGWITVRAFPESGGSITIAGLHGEVSVVRDANGFAHITADDPHDLFLAQGYVHAQDRFWQMEVWRRIGAGRLAELFGASQVDTDRFIRTIGWRQAAARDLEAASQETRDALQAYADGVNAWIDGHAGRLGAAFVVAGLKSGLGGGLGGYAPEPWIALDTVTWGKVQAWNLGGNFDTEIFRMLADARLGDATRTDQLYPAYDPTMPVITPTGIPASTSSANDRVASPVATSDAADGASATASADDPVVTTSDAASAWQDVAAMRGRLLAIAGLDLAGGIAGDHGIGSNNWVIAAAKSASGAPVLANDPHLGFSQPSVWYVVGLHCRTAGDACPYDVAGVSFPGVPGVILGHNARIAWGMTNVGPDVQDLFVETADPANEANYLYRGESLPFETRTETILVAGGAPVEITVRSTVHGPVLNDVDERLADQPPITLEWTATDRVDSTLGAVLAIDRATDFASFREALRLWGAPSQNFIYADVDGHIGYQVPGNLPIRSGAATGERPRDGASGADDWTGTVPFEALPTQYDPPTGMVVTANNAAVDG